MKFAVHVVEPEYMEVSNAEGPAFRTGSYTSFTSQIAGWWSLKEEDAANE